MKITMSRDDVVIAAEHRGLNLPRIEAYLGKQPSEDRLLCVLSYVIYMTDEERQVLDDGVDILIREVKTQLGVTAAFEVITQLNRWLSHFKIGSEELRVGMARYRSLMRREAQLFRMDQRR